MVLLILAAGVAVLAHHPAGDLSWPLDFSDTATLAHIAPAHHHGKVRALGRSAATLSAVRSAGRSGRQGGCDVKDEGVGGDESGLIRPAAFGADPTGRNDSSPAFALAMAALLARCGPLPLPLMGDNVTDCGGAILDLEGGDYLLSAPLRIPPLVGNVHVQRGTLRASASFPASAYLVEVGNATCPEGGQGCCNEHLSFSALMLDAALVAKGGLRINNTMDVVVGPDILLMGHTEAGLAIHGGHEAEVSHAWVGQVFYDDPRWINGTGKGIWLAGPDSVVTQVVVFSARWGVHVAGWLNAVTQVHTWNLHTPFGGIGIYASGSSNRFTDNYLDCNAMYLEGVIDTDVQNTFFLSWANLVLAPGGEIPGAEGRVLHGVRVVGSIFEASDGNASVVLDERHGNAFARPGAATDSVIERGAARAWNATSRPGVRRLLGTRASRTITSRNTTAFSFDFSRDLVFGAIRVVRFSLGLDAGLFARSAARWVPGTATVTVETDEPVSGTCTVDVDESESDAW